LGGLILWTSIDPVFAFGLSSAAAACASWVFAHVYVSRRLAAADQVSMRQLIRLSWPYWINSVATQARNLDATIIGLVAGTAQAGFYAAAARLTSPLRILPTSLASVLLPASSTRNSGNMRGIIKLVGLVVAGLALFYLLLGLAVPVLVPVVLGESYAGAVLALQITAVGLVFAAAASLLGSLLQGVGLKHYVAGTAVVTTAVCLLGVGFGGFVWGAGGAAAGLALSYLVQSVVLVSRLSTFIIRKESNR
jgi:O-antigen/teichoic acid export membrane protein